MAIRKSLAAFNQARQVMVGGVNSPVRSFISVGGNPLVIDHGRGASIVDIDGHRYTDYCLSWGAAILGHANKEVLRAAQQSALKGFSFGTTTRPEIEIAQFLVKQVPSLELVRFVNSGTEATMSAIRVARGYTKKRLVVKFDGCYHGHADDLLIQAGSGVAKLQESSSLGVPRAHVQNTISLPFNNTKQLTDTLHQYREDIACVILEPVAGNMGVVAAQKDFLKVLRYLTAKFNIVLIFDEIMCGFRSCLGCVQQEVGIIPDMTCLGKIIGGGFPVGAYGGRKDIMQCLAPLGGVYQAGTFAGNPVVMRAGLAALKQLTRSMYAELNQKSEKFVVQMNSFFRQHRIPAHFSGYKSMLSLRFRSMEVNDYANAQQASSGEIYARLFNVLLRSGIYWPPADLEAFFISAVHTQHDLERLQNILKDFFIAKGKN